MLNSHLVSNGIKVVGLSEEKMGLEDLFMESPVSRDLVNAGKAKIVGAVYDVSNGTINWLPEAKTTEILKKVEGNSKRAMNAMAE